LSIPCQKQRRPRKESACPRVWESIDLEGGLSKTAAEAGLERGKREILVQLGKSRAPFFLQSSIKPTVKSPFATEDSGGLGNQ